MELPSPDDIAAILSTPFVATYWPVLLGVILSIAAVFRGASWLIIPIMGVAFFGQAWHVGYIG